MILTRQQFGSSTEETFVLNTRTAGDQLRQVRPGSWAKSRRHKWLFNRLNRAKVDEFITFIKVNAGLTVDVTICGVVMTGVVISEEIRIEQTHRATADCNDSALYALEFEFEQES